MIIIMLGPPQLPPDAPPPSVGREGHPGAPPRQCYYYFYCDYYYHYLLVLLLLLLLLWLLLLSLLLWLHIISSILWLSHIPRRWKGSSRRGCSEIRTWIAVGANPDRDRRFCESSWNRPGSEVRIQTAVPSPRPACVLRTVAYLLQ